MFESVSLEGNTMNTLTQGITSLGGRIMIATIFLLSAVGNKIPNFNALAGYMASEGVPAPQLMLVGAIVFLIVGSISLVLGFKARIGAVLLLVFLVLATYYFHDFWNFSGADRQNQMIQFMKNLSMMGAMAFVIANGPGAFSLDRRLAAVTQQSS
jgi:putative oxidoreductase